MKRKVFAIDVDGTICDYDGVLDLEAAHSIRWLRKLGHEVLLSSGRGPWDTFYLGVFIGASKLAVCENGGVLMASPTELKLFSDKTESFVAYDLLSKSFPDVRLKPVSPRLTELVLLRTFDVNAGQNILDRASIPIVIQDSQFALHLTKKGISKGAALKEALELLGIPPEEAIAIGDSATDLSMFDLCGYSMAVGNASEEVKSRADYICNGEIGEGTVEGIRHIAKELSLDE